MKILFFADSLIAGGQERRMLELIKYLKQYTEYEIALVITEDEIFYEYAYELGITIEIIKRSGVKYDPRLFMLFQSFCRRFKPDIIHTWGKMTTFYAIPTKLIHRVPLVSSLIANSSRNFNVGSLDFYFFAVNIFFADVILSNSTAGLLAYKIKTQKAKVIRNGVHLERFKVKYNIINERERLNIKTHFVIVMVASFTISKDYDLFIDIAKKIGQSRDDITFVGVGDGPTWNRIQQRIKHEKIERVILTGDQANVESIIAASDIGLLCTFSEGISNSIIEYMALAKPVIATDLNGGSKEIIIEGETGFCTSRNQEEIIDLINLLLKNDELRISMGEKGRERINSHFSIDRMGDEFENIYEKVLAKKKRIIKKGY
jgi:glycosyltransferase involved in cell wall biosynthesis